MPTIYEPTLIMSAPEKSVNNTGGSEDLDFDFALNEGAKIEKIVLVADSSVGVAGTLDVGVNLKPSAGSPAASGDIFEDDDVVAAIRGRDDGVGNNPVTGIFDFSNDSVYIVKNPTCQYYGAGAAARLGYVKIYYKRCRFSDAELGNLLRNY